MVATRHLVPAVGWMLGIGVETRVAEVVVAAVAQAYSANPAGAPLHAIAETLALRAVVDADVCVVANGVVVVGPPGHCVVVAVSVPVARDLGVLDDAVVAVRTPVPHVVLGSLDFYLAPAPAWLPLNCVGKDHRREDIR